MRGRDDMPEEQARLSGQIRIADVGVKKAGRGEPWQGSVDGFAGTSLPRPPIKSLGEQRARGAFEGKGDDA